MQSSGYALSSCRPSASTTLLNAVVPPYVGDLGKGALVVMLSLEPTIIGVGHVNSCGLLPMFSGGQGRSEISTR